MKVEDEINLYEIFNMVLNWFIYSIICFIWGNCVPAGTAWILCWYKMIQDYIHERPPSFKIWLLTGFLPRNSDIEHCHLQGIDKIKNDKNMTKKDQRILELRLKKKRLWDGLVKLIRQITWWILEDRFLSLTLIAKSVNAGPSLPGFRCLFNQLFDFGFYASVLKILKWG